jgi:hypothetical protein
MLYAGVLHGEDAPHNPRLDAREQYRKPLSTLEASISAADNVVVASCSAADHVLLFSLQLAILGNLAR